MKGKISLFLVITMILAVLASCAGEEVIESSSAEEYKEISIPPHTSREESDDESSSADTTSEEAASSAEISAESSLSEEPSTEESSTEEPSVEELSSEEPSSEEPSKEETSKEEPSEEPSKEEPSEELSKEEPSEEPSKEEPSEEPSEESSEEKPVVNPKGYMTEEGGVIISGTRGMEQFYIDTSKQAGKGLCDTVAKIQEDLGDSATVYLMVPPPAVVYYAPENYSYFRKNGDLLQSSLNEYCGGRFVNIDCHAALKNHTGEDIYLRTEHHWAALGAYYCCKEFAKAANFNLGSLDGNYTKKSITGTVGTLYAFSHDPVLKNNPENIDYYEPNIDYVVRVLNGDQKNFETEGYDRASMFFTSFSNYGVFFALDDWSFKITVPDNDTGRTLVILKDSYGMTVPQFLLFGFDTIYMVDFRYYPRNCVDFCKSVGATDVLVVSSGMSTFGTVWKKLEAMRTK